MKHIIDGFKDAQLTLERFLSNEDNLNLMEKSIRELASCFNRGGRVFSCGNGGSMCDAMHFAEELTGRFRRERKALPATAISDPAHMTCTANDFGYDHIFSRYLEGWADAGDMLLAISTSGNSPNIIQAVEVAKQKNMKTIGLLGKGGGKLKSMVDFPLVIDNAVSDRIQEMHIKIIHLFIEGIEREIFPSNYQ